MTRRANWRYIIDSIIDELQKQGRPNPWVEYSPQQLEEKYERDQGPLSELPDDFKLTRYWNRAIKGARGWQYAIDAGVKISRKVHSGSEVESVKFAL